MGLWPPQLYYSNGWIGWNHKIWLRYHQSWQSHYFQWGSDKVTIFDWDLIRSGQDLATSKGETNILEYLQQIHQIFVLFGEWTMTFTYIYLLFQIHFLTDSLSHSLSHLNIISSFIIYSFFNNYTSSNIFLFNTWLL